MYRVKWWFHVRFGHMIRLKAGDYARCTCGSRMSKAIFDGWELY